MAREVICGVYQIKNKVNGLIYVGSADDIYKRWANHKTYLNKGTHSNNHLQNSWNLYGAENFEFSILETCSHDEKYKLEQKYIDKTKCYDSNFGYNIQRYVVAKDNSKGERSMQAKYTDNQVMEVVKLLQDPDLSYTEIAERTNTSFNLVDQVFTGSSWKHLYEGIEFPLRNSTSFKRKLDTDQIKDIISRILNGDCDSEIAKDYNVDSQTIQNIRLHKSHKELTQDIDFGKYCYKGCKLTKPQVIEIVNLYNNDIKIKDIAAMYSVESGSIYSIINRRSWVHVTKDLYIKPHSQLKHKLTEEEAISILKEYKNGESISILQERYNVGYHAIHKLVSGVTWKNIDRSKI